MADFIRLNKNNIENEHLCCIIRAKDNLGLAAKRNWLKERIGEGHAFIKLNENGCCFIEYAPLEKAWVPIDGDNYLYVYCLWVDKPFKGNGYAKKLMQMCIEEAKETHKSGICMLGSDKQKHWLSDQNFAKHFGFEKVDETQNGYHLLALSFDGNKPSFGKNVHLMKSETAQPTLYYSDQCPFLNARIEGIVKILQQGSQPIKVVHITNLKQAKELPCVFNNFAYFNKGSFVTVNQVDGKTILKDTQE